MKHTHSRWAGAAAFSLTALMIAVAPLASREAAAQAPAQPTAQSGQTPNAPRTPAPNTPRPGVTVPPRPTAAPAAPVANAPPAPPGYVIGPEDVLSIIYWRDKDMSVDVQVRPDGKISLSLLNDVDAAGLTPDQLREKLVEASKEFFEDPNITVVVKTINSRKVFIMGSVAKVGPFPLTAPTTVMQLLALAGGLGEYADSENIRIIRTENGKSVSYKVNYKEVRSGKKLQQNIELKPGDTIVVP